MNRVGHRFDPIPEELADLLEKKNRDPAFTVPDIKDDHIYNHHPSELLGWFFCKLENKYDKSDTLISRTAIGGSWKKTGEDRLVEATDSNKPILIKKIFVFYKDCVFTKENKTNWVMHEYSEIHEDHNSNKQGQVVLCFIKRNPDKKRKPTHIERKPEKKSKRKPSRIERKPEKKRKTSSSLEEGQPSDSGYNVAQDISEDQVVLCRIERKIEKKRKPSRIERKPDKKRKPSSSHDKGPASDSLPYDAQDISEVEPHLQPNQNISPEVRPPVPALQDETIDCDTVCHKSLSTFQSPIYQMPGSFYPSSFSNDSAHWLVQNSLSAQQSPILLPPESSYSGSFSKDATNGLNHSSLSALQWPIHPQPGSSHSSGFSNDATNHSSFSALQWPIHPQPGSSHSSGFSNGSNVLTPRFASERQDDVANSQLIEVKSDQLQPNLHSSYVTTNGFPELGSQLLPNQHKSSNGEDHVAKYIHHQNPSNWLEHISFSALQFLIHPPPESPYSSGFSNDATNELNHSSISSLRSQIHPQPGSSHSSCFSNGSNVCTPQSAYEQEDDLANSRLMEVISDKLQPNQHTSYATTNGFPESESQLPPKQHKSSNGEDLVAKNISSENKSPPLPEPEDISSGLEPLISGKQDAINGMQSPISRVFGDDSYVQNTLLGSESEDAFQNLEWELRA